jgi:hypothetical protein
LRDAQAACCAPHVLFFSHRHEVTNLREAHLESVPYGARAGKRAIERVEIETVLAAASRGP